MTDGRPAAPVVTREDVEQPNRFDVPVARILGVSLDPQRRVARSDRFACDPSATLEAVWVGQIVRLPVADVVDLAAQLTLEPGGDVEIVHAEAAQRLRDSCCGMAAAFRFRQHA